MFNRKGKIMDIMTTTKTTQNLTTQIINIGKNTNDTDIKNAIKNMITLEFFVNFGGNCIVEFDNVTLSSNDIFRAISKIRTIPVSCRRIIPRVIETSDQIDSLVNTTFVYEYLS